MRLSVLVVLVWSLVISSSLSVPLAGSTQGAPPSTAAARQVRLPSIADKTEGMRKLDGLFPLYWDEPNGALYLEIPKLDTEVLYQTGLGAGMGSNDIGLDRGSDPLPSSVVGNVRHGHCRERVGGKS